jgi:hypothetical protein
MGVDHVGKRGQPDGVARSRSDLLRHNAGHSSVVVLLRFGSLGTPAPKELCPATRSNGDLCWLHDLGSAPFRMTRLLCSGLGRTQKLGLSTVSPAGIEVTSIPLE